MEKNLRLEQTRSAELQLSLEAEQARAQRRETDMEEFAADLATLKLQHAKEQKLKKRETQLKKKTQLR